MKHFAIKIVVAQFIMMVCASIAPAQVITLLGYTNQTWRYNDTSTTGSNPQATYMNPSFDDSVAGWKTGFPLFGNDDANVYNSATQPFRGGVNGFATPLDRSGGRVTFYFRTHFNLASAPNAGATLYSTNYLDDGAVFYINGTEVGRTRVPGGALTWDTVGSNPATEGAPTRIDMPITALQVGDNVVAVEVHQSSTTSSDVAFAMNLILINPFCVQITDSTQPADTSVVQSRSFTLRAAANASPPISYQWVKDGTDIPGANSDTYTVVHAALSDEGNYHCRVSNPVCTVNTRDAFVDVIPDQTKPHLIGVVAPDFTTIVAQFDEAMEPTDGANVRDPYNWAIIDPNDNAVGIDNIIAISSDLKVVTLKLIAGETLQENTVYRLGLSGVTDYAGNLIDDVETTFRTYVSGCSGFLFEAFDTASTAGNAVSLLTSHPNYPDNPMDRARIPSFDSRNAYSNDSHEQYGGRIRGLFVPYISGPWTFYLASDDASQLFVNPSGPGAAGKQMVAQETGCCNNFMPAGDAKTSVPINLTAGQAYYVEALYKEGGGGDWLKVAARPSSEPVPTGGNSEAATVSPNVIQGGPAPAGILSGVTISSQPQSQTRTPGQAAQFSVGLSPDVPGCYQWQTNGVDVPGAIGPSFRIAGPLEQSGMRVRAVVSLMGGTTLVSGEAILTIIDDTIPPVVTAVSQALDGSLTVTFSEALDLSTATNRNNYAIDGVTPASAVASSSTVIMLQPSAVMAVCPASHALSYGNIKDANNVLVSPNPSSFSFTLNNLLVLPISAAKTWRYNDSGDELGSAWYANGYDDSGWSNGAATFSFPGTEVIQAGYPVRTTLAGVRFTTYFRTHFTLGSDPSSVTNLQLNAILDDGAVFYLNGQELTRVRMGPGPVDTNTFTTAGSPSDPPQIIETFNLSPALLTSGDNVLAVRLHNVNATSSDEVFAAGIFAQATGCAAPRPRLSITRNGNQVTITSTGAGTIQQSSSLSGPWTPVGAAPQTLTIGPGDKFFEIRP